MKRSVLVAALVSAGCLAIAGSSDAQITRTKYTDYKDIHYPAAFPSQTNVPEIPFDVDPHFFKMPPDLKYGQHIDFGEVSAVTDNAAGHIFVLNRNDVKGGVYGSMATQILEFDEKGNYVREYGHNQYSLAYGHGIRINPKTGNIWVVDKGADMVTEFDYKTGRVLMVLGRRNEGSSAFWEENPGDRAKRPPEDGGFAEPTDIAWDSHGNMYVSDGYVHSRVAKFDPNGTYLGTWGKQGTAPGEFRTVHNIQVDANDHVWVADRTNGRVQVFDTEGNFLKEVIVNVPTKTYTADLGHEAPPPHYDVDNSNDKPQNLMTRPGTPDALCYNPKEKVMFLGDIYPGRVYKMNLDGKVLGYFGHVGRAVGNSGPIHGLACGNANIIYTAEFVNDRVERFVLHPENAKVTGN